jgi:uncharacterized membrane protein
MRAEMASPKLQSRPTDRNISAIIAIEKEALRQRSRGERLGDFVARVAGQLWFIVMHLAAFGFWIAANGKLIPGVRPFDPFPYPFLTFVVSIEAIFLSLFILLSQNRASRQAEERAHLDLQINLLAEQEATKMLQMLQSLCAKLGLPEAADPEVRQLSSPTEPRDLIEELKESLPENC